jgi:glycosyltransferase involved in cell wall biosynthesis
VCHSGHDANACALAVHLGSMAGLLRPRPRIVRMRTYQPGKAGAFGYKHLFDVTFTPSAALREQILSNKAIDGGRIRVLYPGVDFATLRRDADGELPSALRERVAAASPVIVHAAMLRAEKGHAFMLDVVQQLAPRFPRLLYVAAGEGPLHAELAAATRERGLDAHVLLPGMLQHVAPLMRHACVVVMPSTYEPLGMSQVEALSLGVPVVVSRVGGLPETVVDGRTGRVCPPPGTPGALDAWVQALSWTFSEREAAQVLARAGQSQVLEQFDVGKNVSSLVQAFGRR